MTEASEFSRRNMLKHLGLPAAGFTLAGVASCSGAEIAQEAEAKPGVLNVRDFGATGDGKTDDTASFQSALKKASEQGGNLVFVPRGNYLIKGHLNVPENVILEGIWRAPSTKCQFQGSTLLAVAGAGEPEGEPFITLNRSSTLNGLVVFYPEQKNQNPPVPYPWTVRGAGANVSIVNVLLVNPYQAVDFGTIPCGRHYVKGLYAQALYRGIWIDRCLDVGRIEDVHFWPFWETSSQELRDFTKEQGIAFVIGKTDWEYMLNCFCIFYRVGYHFVKTKWGEPNVMLTQCGADLGATAVRVQGCQPHAGVSFVNGQIMAGVEVEEGNRGPVKFTACGFWGIPTTLSHAVLEGDNTTTFTSCHFTYWDVPEEGAPAIDLRKGALTMTACEFFDPDKKHIAIGPEAQAALIYGNRFRNGKRITNEAGERAQISLNAET